MVDMTLILVIQDIIQDSRSICPPIDEKITNARAETAQAEIKQSSTLF
jgi:hypothetical protein